jgi:hypothetical protein
VNIFGHEVDFSLWEQERRVKRGTLRNSRSPIKLAIGHIIFHMTQEAHELLQKALALPENERADWLVI